MLPWPAGETSREEEDRKKRNMGKKEKSLTGGPFYIFRNTSFRVVGIFNYRPFTMIRRW
jgi:hypothetical protein